MRSITNNFTRSVGVVLLAAGSSRRMERPKLLLPWGDTSIIGQQVRTWQNLGAGQVAIVLAGDSALAKELDRINFAATNRISNPVPHEGMFSSIRCAARWTGWKVALTHWAITLGDQPHLRVETLQSLLACAATQPSKISQPLCHGHFRHPVILPEAIFARLASTEAATLKNFLVSAPEGIAGCQTDDPGLDQDIDTPADYQRALALYNSPPKIP